MSLLWLGSWILRAIILIALVLLVRFAVQKRYTVLFTEPSTLPGNYRDDLTDGLGLLVTLQETPSLVGRLLGRETVVTRWRGSNLHWVRCGDITPIGADLRQQGALNRHWAEHPLSDYHLKLLDRSETRALPERTQ